MELHTMTDTQPVRIYTAPIEECPICHGRGRLDWTTADGPQSARCRTCHGTGERPDPRDLVNHAHLLLDRLEDAIDRVDDLIPTVIPDSIRDPGDALHLVE